VGKKKKKGGLKPLIIMLSIMFICMIGLGTMGYFFFKKGEKSRVRKTFVRHTRLGISSIKKGEPDNSNPFKGKGKRVNVFSNMNKNTRLLTGNKKLTLKNRAISKKDRLYANTNGKEKNEVVSRDIFKEFFLSQYKTSRTYTRREKKKKEKKEAFFEEAKKKMNIGSPFIGGVPVGGMGVAGGVSLDNLPKIRIYGLDCRDKRCIAITSLGKLKVGDEIGQGETVLEITPDRIKTNYRVIFY